MDLWKDMVKPDVRGHSGLLGKLNYRGLIKAGVITVLFAVIVSLPSVKVAADSAYTWLYDVKMPYSMFLILILRTAINQMESGRWMLT